MEESVLQSKIRDNKDVQEEILNIINCDNGYEFISEDHYPNGIYADFSIVKNNEVKAIIECKGSEIGVNEYVRGIGQITTYDYFAKNSLSIKNYNFNNTYILFCFPSGIVLNRNFNIGLFPYPEKSKIIELNERNDNIREITRDELKKFAEGGIEDKITISPYYIRDTRIYELYILLHYLQLKKMSGCEVVNRTEIEINELRKIGTQDNRNWRNAFIALSSLGLIDSKNLPSKKGAYYATLSYDEFTYEVYKCYIYPYINAFFELFYSKNTKEIKLSNKEICDFFNDKYNEKQVLFFTDSDNRYLSSWLNIMRDDFGCIFFEPRNLERKLVYNIEECNEKFAIDNIKKYGIGGQYVEKYKQLIKGKSHL